MTVPSIGSTAVSAAIAEATGTELEGGAEFVSNEELDLALAQTDLTTEEREAFFDANSVARIRSLQRGAVVAALIALLGLFATSAVPRRSLAAEGEPVGDDALG